MKLANNLFLDFEHELEAYNGKRILNSSSNLISFVGAMSPKLNGTSFFTDNVLSTSINGKSLKYMPMRDDMNG